VSCRSGNDVVQPDWLQFFPRLGLCFLGIFLPLFHGLSFDLLFAKFLLFLVSSKQSVKLLGVPMGLHINYVTFVRVEKGTDLFLEWDCSSYFNRPCSRSSSGYSISQSIYLYT
jgi:hypothetical protein